MLAGSLRPMILDIPFVVKLCAHVRLYDWIWGPYGIPLFECLGFEVTAIESITIKPLCAHQYIRMLKGSLPIKPPRPVDASLVFKIKFNFASGIKFRRCPVLET